MLRLPPISPPFPYTPLFLSRHAAIVLVRNDQAFPLMIQSEVTRSISHRGLLVQESKGARSRIDRESAHAARACHPLEVGYLIHCVQKVAVGMRREKRRIRGFRRQTNGCELPRRGIEAPHVDALGPPAGVGANIHEIVGAKQARNRKEQTRERYEREKATSHHFQSIHFTSE